jgi:peptidoglycan LD-endopeptidase LytH
VTGRRRALVLGVWLGVGIVAATGSAACGPATPPRTTVLTASPSGPTPSGPSAPQTAQAAPQTPDATTAPANPSGATHYAFPVVGNSSYARDHHDYPATDIIAGCAAIVRAAADGVVLEANRVDRYNRAHDVPGDRGGLSVSIQGDDGVRYYGSHFSSIDAGIVAGVRVAAGTRLGLVGKTGDAGACHLHFGISPLCGRTGDWWIRRGVIWPWPYLDAWRVGAIRSPATEVATWHDAHSCPPAPAG